jgi:hypothetical protein
VRDPEVGQRLVVHAHAAAQPLEGEMLRAQAGHLAGAADPFDGGEQPKRHQDARIGRRMARTSLNRLDCRVERRQVQTFDEAPDQTHPVIRRDQVVQADRPQRHLAPLRRPQTRASATLALRNRLFGKIVEPSRRHRPILSSGETITMATITHRESGDSPQKIHRL